MKRIVFVLNSLIAVVTLLLYGSTFVSPEKLSKIASASLLTPVFVFLNILFVVYWLIQLNKRALVSLLVLALNLNGVQKLFQFSFTEKITSDNNNSLKIMTYNVHELYSPTLKKNTDQEIKEFITKESPDILFLQESSNRVKVKSILDLYPYSNDYKSLKNGYADAILTKHKIINSGFVDLKAGYAKYFGSYADVLIKKDTIRLYNLHLASFKFSQNSEVLQKEGPKSIVKRLNRVFKYQDNQIFKLEKHIKECPYKIIIAGDFNNNAYSYIYRRLMNTSKFQDTFVEKGSGFGSTFYFKYFPTRIDFIFAPITSKVLSHKVIKQKDWSDHYPVISEIKL